MSADLSHTESNNSVASERSASKVYNSKQNTKKGNEIKIFDLSQDLIPQQVSEQEVIEVQKQKLDKIPQMYIQADDALGTQSNLVERRVEILELDDFFVGSLSWNEEFEADKRICHIEFLEQDEQSESKMRVSTQRSHSSNSLNIEPRKLGSSVSSSYSASNSQVGKVFNSSLKGSINFS